MTKMASKSLKKKSVAVNNAPRGMGYGAAVCRVLSRHRVRAGVQRWGWCRQSQTVNLGAQGPPPGPCRRVMGGCGSNPSARARGGHGAWPALSLNTGLGSAPGAPAPYLSGVYFMQFLKLFYVFLLNSGTPRMAAPQRKPTCVYKPPLLPVPRSLPAPSLPPKFPPGFQLFWRRTPNPQWRKGFENTVVARGKSVSGRGGKPSALGGRLLGLPATAQAPGGQDPVDFGGCDREAPSPRAGRGRGRQEDGRTGAHPVGFVP